MEVAVAQVVGRREVGERKEDPGRRVLVGAALARDGGGQVFGACLTVQLPEPPVAPVSGTAENVSLLEHLFSDQFV